MVRDPYAQRAEDLQRWRERFPDTTPVAELTPRHPATVVGVVHAIRLVPGRCIEVVVDDGSGRLVAEWSHRSSLPGLELGAALRISGTVAADRNGRLRMRNPEFTGVIEPYT